MKINQNSDFKIEEKIIGQNIDAPFEFRYYVKGSNATLLTASFKNGAYVNCRKTPEGSILVAFDAVNKPLGLLYVNRTYFLTDADYQDGICNLVTDEYVNVEFINGKSDGTYIQTTVYPNYQKGDKGDAMTWDQMTQADKDEITNAALAQITAPIVVDSSEYPDIFTENI